MTHNIPLTHVEKHSKAISDTKRTQVSNLQNHIQEILGDTHYTFLQGSYANDTSIADINDVDIVAVRKNTYSSVHSEIETSGSVDWNTIFSEIETKLTNQNLYKWTINRGDKCITVETSTFKADIVPSVQVGRDIKADPIVIHSFKLGSEIINYPKTHIDNGVKKHDLTNKNFKPMVRMFKNWSLNHFNNSGVVSSYHIESLVYNSDNENFTNDYALSFILIGLSILDLLKNKSNIICSVCGSEDITSNWNSSDKQVFEETLTKSLNHAITAYKASTIQDAQSYWLKAYNY
jgi:hypothetical protein